MRYLDKKSKLLLLTIFICLVISIICTTYAFFMGNVLGNDSAKENVVETGEGAFLEYIDGPYISLSNLEPGDTLVKQFTVKNNGDQEIDYDVYFSNVVNTFVDKSDLVYTVSSDLGCIKVGEEVLPSTEDKMISTCHIGGNEVHNYTVTITFKETNDIQDDNMGKFFNAKVSINDYKEAKKFAVLEAGAKFNEDMKILAGDILDDQVYADVAQYGAVVNFFEYHTYYSYKANTNIKHIVITKDKPSLNKVVRKVSSEDSPYEILIWFENNTIYFYSEADKFYFGTDASHAFDALEALQELDLSQFDTSNSFYFSNMFDDAPSLANLNLGKNFDTRNAVMMDYMFDYNSSMTSLDLGDKFDTSNVVNMRMMFAAMIKLETLELGDKFDTSKVNDMSQMFYYDGSLKSLDLKDKFDTSNVTNMTQMFSDMRALETINLGDKFNTSKVTDMSSMFASANNLKELDLGDLFDTSNVENIASFLTYASSLKTLDLGNKFDLPKATKINYMFNNMTSLETIYIGKDITFKSGVNGGSLFTNSSKLVGGAGTKYSSGKDSQTYARIDGGTANPGYFTLKTN